jgi:hypothetical protein
MNVEVINEGGVDMLVIKTPLEHPRPSASGKTNVVVSSGGFTKLQTLAYGKPVSVNLTVTIPKD